MKAQGEAMNTEEARKQLQRVLTAFPSYRQWLESTSNPRATIDIWCEMLTDCHSIDVEAVVTKVVAGDLDLVGRYEKPDVLAKNLKREANEMRFRRTAKQTQQENYHGQSRGAMASVAGTTTGHWSIKLGQMVRSGSISKEQNDERMNELMEWDKEQGEKPEWMTEQEV